MKRKKYATGAACPGGTIGSVTVCAIPGYSDWHSLGSSPRLANHLWRIIVMHASRLNSRAGGGFDGVLFKLWPLANTGFRGTQSLVPAWTTDNRRRCTASIGRPLVALFARAAKLGPEPTAPSHASAKPSVMQSVLAVRETVIIKPSSLNTVAETVSASLHRSLP